MEIDLYAILDEPGVGYIGRSILGVQVRWAGHAGGARRRARLGRPGRYRAVMEPDLRRHHEDYLASLGRLDALVVRPLGILVLPDGYPAWRRDAGAEEERWVRRYLAKDYLLTNYHYNPAGRALAHQLKQAWRAGRREPRRCPYLRQRPALAAAFEEFEEEEE